MMDLDKHYSNTFFAVIQHTQASNVICVGLTEGRILSPPSV